LNTRVTKELVESEDPDALFIAAGGELIKPDIPGIDNKNVLDVLTADSGKAEIGQNVVVCGGGLSGLECALALAMDKKNVTVVDMIPTERFGGDMFILSLNMLKKLLKENNVKLIGSSKVEGFSDKGVQIIDKEWERRVIPADTIVTAFGIRKNSEAVEELQGIIAETYVIGDCYSAGGIHSANTAAFNYAVEV